MYLQGRNSSVDYFNILDFPLHCRIHTAAKKAYRVAVQNFSEARITCACVAFTEMLGADSTYLRVDIQSANRILSHGGWEGLVDGDSRNVISPKEAIGWFSCITKFSQNHSFKWTFKTIC